MNLIWYQVHFQLCTVVKATFSCVLNFINSFQLHGSRSSIGGEIGPYHTRSRLYIGGIHRYRQPLMQRLLKYKYEKRKIRKPNGRCFLSLQPGILYTLGKYLIETHPQANIICLFDFCEELSASYCLATDNVATYC